MREQIEEWVRSNRRRIEDTFLQLHELAELSWKEFETSAFLRRQLDEILIGYDTFDDHAGVVATWRGSGGSGQRVAGLRADMDALWQQTADGWKAVHSCGHDAHMTMVLNAVRCLREIGFEPAGTLKVIFQPAEEGGQGAKKLSAQGVVDDIDALLGIHLRPVAEVPDGFASPAIYHASTGRMEAYVTGKAAHAARPHQGINAADMLAAIVHAVNAIRPDPRVPASAKVTILRTEGTAGNIIPDSGYCYLDLRAQTNEAMDTLIETATRAVEGAGASYGGSVHAQLASRGAAASPDPWMEALVAEAIDELGDSALHAPPVSPGAEDFHLYRVHKPQLRATMVGLGCGMTPGLHDPEMRFNIGALSRGAAILALSAVKMFDRPLPVESAE